MEMKEIKNGAKLEKQQEQQQQKQRTRRSKV